MKRILIIIIAILCVTPSFSQTLEWHIKDEFADIKYMGNDLFKVKTNTGKWGVINKHGKMSIEAKYDSITPIVENRALLLDITGNFLRGIIDENGNILKSFGNGVRLTHYKHFKEGYLPYGIESANIYLFGYLDKFGESVIEPQYFWASPFHEGKAVIQYSSGNYGIINTSGDVAMFDNRKIKFITSPVNNELMYAISTNRGDKIILAEYKNNKLKDLEILENGTIVYNTYDYRSIYCQNGHVYNVDEAMRLISSSTGRKFNDSFVMETDSNHKSLLQKTKKGNEWSVTYNNNSITQTLFRSVDLCGNEYAIVSLNGQDYGVVKTNYNGILEVINTPQEQVFYHNKKANAAIAVILKDILPTTQVYIGIKGLSGNMKEEKIAIPENYSGVYNHDISYFITSTKFNEQVTLPITINLYLDNMIHSSQDCDLTAVHKRGFEISDIIAPEYSDTDGNAKISFKIQSIGGRPSSAEVIVKGSLNERKHFNGNDFVDFSKSVTVPEDEIKDYTFTITVKENGCPSYTKTIRTTIKNYFLQ